MAGTPSPFLALPREIRDAIYLHYVTVDGGYMFNSETSKLICADGSRIDKSLVFTCKQVAQEITGLGFRCNTINFTTLYSDATRVLAARWDKYWDHQQLLAATMLGIYCQVYRTKQRMELVQAWIDKIALKYPNYEPVLEAMLEREDDLSEFLCWTLPVAPSTCSQALFYAFQVSVDALPEHPDWSQELLEIQTTAQVVFKPIHDGARPWHLPTADELELFVEYASQDKPHDIPFRCLSLHAAYWESPHVSVRGDRRYTQGKYRFSAASVAHSFLSRLPEHLRLHLRNLHLHEDHTSVADPASHAQGLVSFCLENPLLRIVRRVDMWRTVIVGLSDALPYHSPEEWWLKDGCAQTYGSECLAVWISEALVLPSYGMPEQSFTLLLDAGQSPEQCTSFFQNLVQKHAAWQDVWERVLRDRGIKSPAVLMTAECYVAQGFPQAIADIANDVSPIIKTTFDASQGRWNADAEYIKSRDRDLEEVEKARKMEILDAWDPIEHTFVGLAPSFELEPPLPSFRELLAENILPDFFEDQDWSRVDENDAGDSLSEDSDDDADADADDEAADQGQGDEGQGLQASESTFGISPDGVENQIQSSDSHLSGDESDDEMLHSDHSD